MIVCDYELGEVKKRELTSDEKQSVCDYVVQRWNSWSKPLEVLQDNTRIIRDRATPTICDIKQPQKKKDWHSDIKLNRMYEFYNKLYGILYETFITCLFFSALAKKSLVIFPVEVFSISKIPIISLFLTTSSAPKCKYIFFSFSKVRHRKR